MADDWTMADAIKLTFTVEEFDMAFAIAMAAGSGAMPTESPTTQKVSLEDKGKVTTYRFTDNTMNRVMFAVREHFDRGIKASAFMFRFWALGELMKDSRMRRWTRPDGDDHSLIFEGVGEAAATLPLHVKTLKFNADAFFSRVEALYDSGKYRHTGEVWDPQ
jgi:hypothetical protein